MSYNISKDTITVDGVEYDIKRESDYGHPEDTLTVTIFDVEQDEFVDAFPGLEATLGAEEYIEDWMSPRDWSNVGTMAVSYRRYNLGDEDISEINFETECDACDEYCQMPHPEREGETIDCGVCDGYGVKAVNPVDYFKRERGARVVIGLTVYEHSGITMYAGDVTTPFDTDRWDTSFVGFIFDTPEGVKQCIGDDATDEQIEQALRAEVSVYASYLEGDVSRYFVQDEETGFHDSCGGFIGDATECEDQCFAALESAIEKRLAENNERAYWMARGVETV